MSLGLIFAGQIRQLQARFCDAFFSTPQNGADPSSSFAWHGKSNETRIPARVWNGTYRVYLPAEWVKDI